MRGDASTVGNRHFVVALQCRASEPALAPCDPEIVLTHSEIGIEEPGHFPCGEVANSKPTDRSNELGPALCQLWPLPANPHRPLAESASRPRDGALGLQATRTAGGFDDACKPQNV